MSAESRPDCPDGVLEAMEPSIFTPRTKRSALTPGGGSRPVSGHFPAAGGAAEGAGSPWPVSAPWPDGFDFPPPQAAAIRVTTTNTRRRGYRITRMWEDVLYRPPVSHPSVGDLCRISVPGSVLDEPEGDLPVEGAEALAVPRPAGAPRPGARQGAGRPVHTLQMLEADAALLCRSAAGVPAVGGPDAPPGGAGRPPAGCPRPQSAHVLTSLRLAAGSIGGPGVVSARIAISSSLHKGRFPVPHKSD